MGKAADKHCLFVLFEVRSKGNNYYECVEVSRISIERYMEGSFKVKDILVNEKNIKNRCNCEVYFFDHTGFKEGVIIVLSLESNEVRAFIRSDNKGYSVFRSFFFEF